MYSYLLGIRPQDLSKPPGANDPVPASSSQEVEELVSLKAGSNSIRELDVEFGAFGALKTIDVSSIGSREQTYLLPTPARIPADMTLSSAETSSNPFQTPLRTSSD